MSCAFESLAPLILFILVYFPNFSLFFYFFYNIGLIEKNGNCFLKMKSVKISFGVYFCKFIIH